MMNYFKALAIIFTLFALASAGTALTTPTQTLDIASAKSTRTCCAHPVKKRRLHSVRITHAANRAAA